MRALKEADLASRVDQWVNTISGLGSEDSKGQSTQFVGEPKLDAETIKELVRSNWLAQRIIKLVPDQCFAKGYTVGESAWLAKRKLDRLNHAGRFPEGALQQWLYTARSYGVAILILGVRSGVGNTELPMGEGAKELLFLDVAGPEEIEVRAYIEDAEDPQVGMPEVIELKGDHPRAGQLFHHSRFMWSIGNPAIGSDKFDDERHGGIYGDSVLQAPYSAVGLYGISWEAVSHLLQESSMVVLTMKGLFRAIAEENEGTFKARIELMNRAKSVVRMLLLQEGEKAERLNVAWSELPALMAEMSLTVAGACNLPAVKLFGRSPAGMNATGESDLMNYYDDVEVYRRLRVEPAMIRLLEMCGAPDFEATQEQDSEEQWQIYWPSMWSMTAGEAATQRKTLLDGDNALADLGVPGELVARARLEAGWDALDLEIDLDELQAEAAAKAQAEAEQAERDAAALAAAQQGPPVNESVRQQSSAQQGQIDGNSETQTPTETPAES